MFFFIIRHTAQNTPIALSVKDLAMVQRAFGLYFGCKDTHYFSICQIFPQKNSIYFSKPSAFRPGKNERFDCRKSNQIRFEITPYVSGGEDGELPQAPTAAAQLRQRYTAPRKSPDDCNVSPCDTPSAPNPNHNIES